jgi:ribulose kinase
LARRHRLSGLDVWRVQQAVAEGVRAEPARLREPAVAFAELVLAQNPRGRAGLGRRPLLRRVLVVAYGLVAVAVLVKDPAMIGTVFVGALAAGLRVQQKRAARRAIQANAAAHDDVAADVDASSG